MPGMRFRTVKCSYSSRCLNKCYRYTTEFLHCMRATAVHKTRAFLNGLGESKGSIITGYLYCMRFAAVIATVINVQDYLYNAAGTNRWIPLETGLSWAFNRPFSPYESLLTSVDGVLFKIRVCVDSLMTT